jgi:hypothetical protein
MKKPPRLKQDCALEAVTGCEFARFKLLLKVPEKESESVKIWSSSGYFSKTFSNGLYRRLDKIVYKKLDTIPQMLLFQGSFIHMGKSS